KCFRNARLCSTAAGQSATTTEAATVALVSAGLSRDAGRVMRTRQHAVIERAQCRLHRARQIESLGVNDGAARARTWQKFAIRWRGVVEPDLYTVEGRQTVDLR